MLIGTTLIMITYTENRRSLRIQPPPRTAPGGQGPSFSPSPGTSPPVINEVPQTEHQVVLADLELCVPAATFSM